MKTYANFEELAKSGNHEIEINSDLLRFTTLYRGFGVECKIAEFGDPGYRINLADGYMSNEIDHTYSDKLEGHTGFYTAILFDKNGKFIKQGFWE